MIFGISTDPLFQRTNSMASHFGVEDFPNSYGVETLPVTRDSPVVKGKGGTWHQKQTTDPKLDLLIGLGLDWYIMLCINLVLRVYKVDGNQQPPSTVRSPPSTPKNRVTHEFLKGGWRRSMKQQNKHLHLYRNCDISQEHLSDIPLNQCMECMVFTSKPGCCFFCFRCVSA